MRKTRLSLCNKQKSTYFSLHSFFSELIVPSLADQWKVYAGLVYRSCRWDKVHRILERIVVIACTPSVPPYTTQELLSDQNTQDPFVDSNSKQTNRSIQDFALVYLLTEVQLVYDKTTLFLFCCRLVFLVFVILGGSSILYTLWISRELILADDIGILWWTMYFISAKDE